jgi:hypothetical protein
MKRLWPLLLLACLPLLYSARTEYASAQRKLELLEGERLKPGAKVTFTQRELNAYAAEEIPKIVPEGVRGPKLDLGVGSATGSALVDFVKLRNAQGKPPSWLMRQMLAGEHPVTVTARIESSGGHATVEVQRVEVSGMVIEGRMLDFLIQNYLLPYYPDAKIGQPFALAHHIDRLDVQPARVDVILGK